MKQLKYLMLPLLMLPTLCACSDDEATTKPVIKGDTKEVTVGYEAASTRLTVTATEGYDITIEQEYAQWLSAEMQTDYSLNITCTENTETQSRTGRVILRKADVMWIFTVNQAGAPGEEEGEVEIAYEEMQVIFNMHFYSISAAEAKKIGVGRKLIIETTEMEGNVALSDANNAEIASLNLSDGVVSMNWTEEMAALAVEGMRVRLSTGTNNIVRVYTTAPDPEYFIDVPSATEMYGMNIYQFAAGIFKDLPVGTVIGFYFTSSEGTPTLTDASNNTLFTDQLWDGAFWVTWTQEMADATVHGARLRMSTNTNPLVKIQYWP